MIVQPDFPIHWKTKLLVKITGDVGAPMAVIRLWAHCQHNRRGEFPDMTPAQLDSICEWGDRKPACHLALVKSGFVDKLPGGGFAAHEWTDHNAQLLQKWQAGQKGGRPARATKPNEDGPTEKPIGLRPITDREPGRNPIDQIRPDQIEEIEKTSPSNAPVTEGPGGAADASGGGAGVSGSGPGGDGAVNQLVVGCRKPTFIPPTVEQIRNALAAKKPILAEFAEDIHALGTKQGWRDGEGKPVGDWIRWALGVANGLERKRRGVGRR